MKGIKSSLASLSLVILSAWSTQASAAMTCKTNPNSPLAEAVFMSIVSLVEEGRDVELIQSSPDGCTEVAARQYSKILICGEEGQSISAHEVIESASEILDHCTTRIATLKHTAGFVTLDNGMTVSVERSPDENPRAAR